jgi:hypothetical protein
MTVAWNTEAMTMRTYETTYVKKLNDCVEAEVKTDRSEENAWRILTTWSYERENEEGEEN